MKVDCPPTALIEIQPPEGALRAEGGDSRSTRAQRVRIGAHT